MCIRDRTKLVAALFNSPFDEITAIQTELGVDVAGTAADLVTRLAVCLADDGTFQNTVYDYGTSVDAPATETLENVHICRGRVTIASGATATFTGLPFTSATSYDVVVFESAATATAYYNTLTYISGASFSILNGAGGGGTVICSWIAIGT